MSTPPCTVCLKFVRSDGSSMYENVKCDFTENINSNLNSLDSGILTVLLLWVYNMRSSRSDFSDPGWKTAVLFLMVPTKDFMISYLTGKNTLANHLCQVAPLRV